LEALPVLFKSRDNQRERQVENKRVRARWKAWGKIVAKPDPIELVVEIVAASVSCNSRSMAEAPQSSESAHAVAKGFAESGEAAATNGDPPSPAVPIGESIASDYLICLEDGKRFKSMRLHLKRLGITPEEYRAKWGLPSTYPMVAPDYAAQRSAMAKSLGLGRISAKYVAAPPQSPTERKPDRPRKGTV
jgi:predicted transcriptional regulator